MKLGAAAGAIVGGAGALAIAGANWAGDAIAFKDQSFAAMTAFLGSEDAAQGIMDRTLGIASDLRIVGKDALEGVNQLLGAGIESEKAMKLFQASLDLKALKGADPKALATILGQIKAKGKLQTEELLQLAESGGLGVDKVQQALGGLMGIDVTTKAGMDKLTKALEGGAVNSTVALDAVMIAIQKMTGKGLGEFARGARNSIGSLKEGFASLPELLVMNANTSGLQPLLDFAGKLLDTLNPTTVQGKRLVGMVSQLATEIGGAGFAKMDVGKLVEDFVSFTGSVIKLSKAFLDGGFGTFIDAMKPIGEIFSSAAPGATEQRMRMLGQALGALAAGFFYVGLAIGAVAVGFYVIGKAVVDFVGWIGKSIADLVIGFTNIVASFTAFGTNIVNAILGGITAAWGGLKTKWNALIGELPAAVSSKLEIKSPSRVMERLGINTIEGFTKGVENDNAGPAGAVAAVVSGPSLAAPQAAASAPAASAPSGGGGFKIEINVNVVASPGMSQGEADAIGQRVGEAAAAQLAGVLEDLAKQVAA
jgi:hypothetical protein